MIRTVALPPPGRFLTGHGGSGRVRTARPSRPSSWPRSRTAHAGRALSRGGHPCPEAPDWRRSPVHNARGSRQCQGIIIAARRRPLRAGPAGLPGRNVRAGMARRPLRGLLLQGVSGDPVEVAHFHSGQKMTPLIDGELPEGPFRTTGVTDHDKIAVTCNRYALAIVTGPGNTPVQIPCSRHAHSFLGSRRKPRA